MGFFRKDDVKHHLNGKEFAFSLTEQSAENIFDVRIRTWQVSPDGKYLLDPGHGRVAYLGPYPDSERKKADDYHVTIASDGRDAFSTYTVGTKSDTFWSGGASKLTSEPIACYFIGKQELSGENNYLVPVTVNGVDAYLKGSCVWYGSSDDSVSDRAYTELTDDDVVIPRFNAISLETGEETTFYGIPINFSKFSDGRLYWTMYPNSKFTNVTYYVNFELIDAFGNIYMTDYARIEKKFREPTKYSMVPKDKLGQAG